MAKILSLILFGFGFTSVRCAVSESASAMKQFLDETFHLYDKGFRPDYGEAPLRIGVTAYILGVDSVDEKNMEFTFTFYFRQTWNDLRLSYGSVPRARGKGDLVKRSVTLGEDRRKKIWRPDTFFVNEKTFRIHESTGSNEFVRVQSNGTVLQSGRYTVKASCPMDLSLFPFDKVLCQLDIESFSNTMEDIVYYWAKDEDSLNISPSLSIPGLVLIRHRIDTVEIYLGSGNHSRLTIGLEFKRAHVHYLIRCYLPMAIFVTVSLLTLLFANPFLEPLIHVVTISFLILHSQQTWIQNLPMISYLSSIFLYFFICLTHLLLALFGKLYKIIVNEQFMGTTSKFFLVSLAAAYRYLRQSQTGDGVCIICKPLTELDDYHHRGTNDRRRSPPKQRKSCTAGAAIFYFFKLLVLGGFVASNVVYFLLYRTLTYATNQTLVADES